MSGDAAEAAPEPPPARVETAFALGWHLAELRHAPQDPADDRPEPASCLPQVQNFGLTNRVDLLVRQLEQGLKSFPAASNVLKTVQKDFGDLEAMPKESQAAESRLRWAHVELLKILTSEDYRLGKAYGIGVQLAETVLLSYAWLRAARPDDATIEPLWDRRRIQLVTGQMQDLKTVFQDYAVDAATATLLDWSNTFAQWSKGTPEELKKIGEDNLYPQGAAWRAMLSGERLPTDFLQVSEYVRAIANLLRAYASFARAFLRRSPLLGLALVLLIGMLGAAAYLGLRNQAQVQAAYATLIGVLGVLGVSAATVVAAVRRALSTAGDHLWQAETAYAVAVAVDWVPVKSAESHVERLGRLSIQDRRPAAGAGRGAGRRGAGVRGSS